MTPEILIAIGSLFVLFLVFKPFRIEIVHEYEIGLLYRQGKFVKTLKPGGYWLLKRTRIQNVDLRKRTIAIPGQEILTADNIALKVSLILTYTITDPEKAFHTVADYNQELYIAAQLALRDIVGGLKADELLSNRQQIGKKLLETTVPSATKIGLALEIADIRDITFPGDLKNIFAEVLRAQKEGLASLERARGETAALRNLANAASMIDNNPNLIQLRTLQAISSSTGNTFVVGVPSADALVKKTVKTQNSKGK
jgi:regulator of protease activity HflC (stomatin/prohibitin superfamily)